MIFTIRTAAGDVFVGEVHGSAGLLRHETNGRPRLERAITLASTGRPLSIYEPARGHVKLYPVDGGDPVHVDIRNATIVEVKK